MTATVDTRQPEYLVRRAGRGSVGSRYVQVRRLVARRIEIHKATGETIGPFAVAKGTGRYLRDELRLAAPREDVTDAYGRRAAETLAERLRRSASGVKDVVRRLRPEEAAELDRIDSDIDAAKARLDALRTARKDAVARAWQRAHAVRLADVEALIDVPFPPPPADAP